MGTDIHIWLEKKARNGKWVYVEPLKGELGRNKYRDEYEKDGADKEPYHGDARIPHDWDMSRNYNAFAILADVRNGRGFAGVKTGDGFNPILPASGPGILGDNPHTRGWPEDCSPEVAAILEAGIEHTPSWLLLSEINDYDWTQKTRCTGVISLEEFINWKEKKGAPDSWSGSVMGRAHMTLNPEDAERLLKERPLKALLKGDVHYTVQVEWEQTYAEAVYDFHKEHIPALNRVASREGVTPDKLRLVFYFDS